MTKIEHSGHKARLRKKALTNFELLEEHEVLELLLNYGIVRSNTNLIAHNLLNKFGTISNIMEAEIDALLEVEGLGEVGASLLHFLPQIANSYFKSKNLKITKINNTQEATDYFNNILRGLNREELHALCLDKQNKIIASVKLASGDLDTINIEITDIITKIAKYKPYQIYIAHNHVIDNAYPSIADEHFTKALNATLKTVKILLLDHIIISLNNTFSLKSHHLL